MALVSWLNYNVFGLAVRSSSTVEVFVKHLSAESCAEGVAASMLDAPCVKTQLHRDSEFSFRLESRIEPGVRCLYLGLDDVSDKLLNRFAMGYFKPADPDETASHTSNPSKPCAEGNGAACVGSQTTSTTTDVDGHGDTAAMTATDAAFNLDPDSADAEVGTADGTDSKASCALS
eukprot:6202993-Pleurochrysis_carterae.AAC.2